MTTLNSNPLRQIGSFLGPKDLGEFPTKDWTAAPSNGLNLKKQYEMHFGSVMNEALNPDGTTVRSLLSFVGKQPNGEIDHNVYQVPTDRLERWKWIVGVENALDRKVQENYENNIRLLKGSQATSIIQLKNQLIGFWHCNQEIRDYEKFKSKVRSEAEKGKINAIFFKCVGFILRLYYNPSRSLTNLVKPLISRSETTFAKIGAFKLDNKSYDVVAFHPLADNAAQPTDPSYGIRPHFLSSSDGKTLIGILEQSQCHKTSLFNLPWFEIQIARKEKNNYRFQLSSEDSDNHGKEAVLKNQRHLLIRHHFKFKGSTTDPHGSDRLLDQKLTQIMVEMTMQNNDIISLRTHSVHDDLPVLIAGGFASHKSREIIQELEAFRAMEENKLFPPYRDYSSNLTEFYTKIFQTQRVYYSRDTTETWAEILKRSTILNPDAAVLPEYWVKAPKIVEG